MSKMVGTKVDSRARREASLAFFAIFLGRTLVRIPYCDRVRKYKSRHAIRVYVNIIVNVCQILA